MTTAWLLWCGVVGAVLFVVVWAVEGALRPDYRPSYHPVSALALGARGRIQVASFVVSGLLLTAFGIGVVLAVEPVASAAVGGGALTMFGLALVASGVFPMDPMRGYPPGAPTGTPETFTRTHHLHDHAGVAVFLTPPVAGVALVPALSGGWRVYTAATVLVGLALFAWFGSAWEADGPRAGAVQRVMIVVDWAWVALLGIHLLATLDG